MEEIEILINHCKEKLEEHEDFKNMHFFVDKNIYILNGIIYI